MDQNSKKGNLKGKRKKLVPENANPLFSQWLAEWRDEAAEKGWKSHHTYAKALKTLKLFPLPLESGKDCKLLQNFGDKICKMLDEKLAEYKRNNPNVPAIPEKTSKVPQIIPGTTTANNFQKEPSSSKAHVISDNSDSEPDKYESPPKKKKSSQRRSKEYIPGYRTGSYALILTIYRYMRDPDFKGFLTKSELCNAAQRLSEKSFTLPDPGSHYTAWSSMSSLIKRGLVQKDGCPARYNLTDDGFKLGSRLENVETGKGAEDVQSSPDLNLSGNGSSGLTPSSNFIAEACPVNAFTTKDKPSPPSSHIVLSDSEDEIVERDMDWNMTNGNNFSENFKLHDNPVYVLSDDENGIVNDKINKFPPRSSRLHSLSPSSSSSPASPTPICQESYCTSTSLYNNNNINISYKDSAISELLPTEYRSPKANEVDEVIEIENDDDVHAINFTSDSKTSKFSWEAQKNQNVFQTAEEDSDELPDLDQFIPLSKRLMAKGIVSSTLLNAHISDNDKNKPTLVNHSVNTIRASTSTTTQESFPIDVESIGVSRSEKSFYTSVQVKSLACHSSSTKAITNSNPKVDNVTVSTIDISPKSPAPSHTSTANLTNSKPVPTFTLQPGTFDIILCVDQREFYGSKSNSKTLLPDLIKSGVECDLRHLNISDLLWIAREKSNPIHILESSNRKELVLNYAIERKRMDDLVSSISSGRLKEQKFRLKHSGISELIILIEEYGSIQNFSLSEDRIKQSIVNSQIIDGFKVKRCGGSREAVTYLSMMTRFLQSHYHSKTLHAVSQEWLKDNKNKSIHDSEQYLMPFDVFNEASIKQKVLSVREMFAKHLLQLPGISIDRASAITNVYPSLSLLIEAYKRCVTEKEKESLLASIKCGNKGRNLGIAVSRTVNMMYNASGSLS